MCAPTDAISTRKKAPLVHRRVRIFITDPNAHLMHSIYVLSPAGTSDVESVETISKKTTPNSFCLESVKGRDPLPVRKAGHVCLHRRAAFFIKEDIYHQRVQVSFVFKNSITKFSLLRK